MKKIITALFFSFLLTGVVDSASAQVVVVVKPNPPARRVHKPARAMKGHTWIGGHWRWNARSHRYVWVKGHYVRNRRGHRWVAGRWVAVPGRGHKWVPGHWKRG